MKKKDNTEKRIRSYIKDKTRDNRSLKKSLAEIAQETDCSTATVWRVMQRLQDQRVIKIVKSKLKTEPDTVFYLGEQNDIAPLTDQLNKMLYSTNILVQELEKQLTVRQKLIDELRYELQTYKDREKKILQAVKID